MPDLHGFVAGIATILKPDGVAVIETPYVRDLVERLEFDTIYHEHRLLLLALVARSDCSATHGLVVATSSASPIHGGSLRVFAVHAAAGAGIAASGSSVATLLEEEQTLGRRRASATTATSRPG